jgi:hypothetical protein
MRSSRVNLYWIRPVEGPSSQGHISSDADIRETVRAVGGAEHMGLYRSGDRWYKPMNRCVRVTYTDAKKWEVTFQLD